MVDVDAVYEKELDRAVEEYCGRDDNHNWLDAEIELEKAYSFINQAVARIQRGADWIKETPEYDRLCSLAYDLEDLGTDLYHRKEKLGRG